MAAIISIGVGVLAFGTQTGTRSLAIFHLNYFYVAIVDK